MKFDSTTTALTAAQLVRLGAESLALATALQAIEKAKAPAAPSFKTGDLVTYKNGPVILKANVLQAKGDTVQIAWRKGGKLTSGVVKAKYVRHAA